MTKLFGNWTVFADGQSLPMTGRDRIKIGALRVAISAQGRDGGCAAVVIGKDTRLSGYMF